MSTHSVDLSHAQHLIQHALEAVQQHGVAVAATVVDQGGHLVACARMDDASYIAVESSRRKALTAGTFKAPTHALAQVLEHEPRLAAEVANHQQFACLLPGGLPIMDGARCVGGLGIAGGNYSQDQTIAEYALAQ